MFFPKLLRMLAFLFFAMNAFAVSINNRMQGFESPSSRLREDRWPAYWIMFPNAPRNEYGVYLFRKQFELAQKPDRFLVHVTGDARYRFFVNGRSVSFGPQRSDPSLWRFE